MTGTPDLPDGFFRLPGHGNTILHRSAVIGVRYVPTYTPMPNFHATPHGGVSWQPAEVPEHCIITIQGGKECIVQRVTFWQVLEWLK